MTESAPKSDTATMSLRLPIAEMETLRELAEAECRSATSLIRSLIRKHAEKTAGE